MVGGLSLEVTLALSLTPAPAVPLADALTDPRPPSAREQLQSRLMAFVARDAARWTAPYGIVAGIEPLPKGGAARSVYFGIRDILHVRVTIFTPRDIRINAAGDLAGVIEGRYPDIAAVESAVQRLRQALSGAGGIIS